MSAVDVLRVLDEAVRFQAYGDDLQEARAAVAELIEAATLHLNKIGCGTSLDCEYCDRLRAALAEMGGKV